MSVGSENANRLNGVNKWHQFLDGLIDCARICLPVRPAPLRPSGHPSRSEYNFLFRQPRVHAGLPLF